MFTSFFITISPLEDINSCFFITSPLILALILFKNHISTYNYLLGRWIIKSICFRFFTHPKQHTLKTLIIQLLSLIVWHMNMANASKNPKIINIGFDTTPSLFRSHIFHYQCRTSIKHMHCPIYYFWP